MRNQPKSNAVKTMIRNPHSGRRMREVYANGQWYQWNTAYHVYNGARNYEQLQKTDKVDFNKQADTNAKV